MKPSNDLLNALYRVYPDAAILMNPRTAHLVVDGQRLVSRQAIPGVEVRAEQIIEGALVAEVTVGRAVRVENPIHSCVGLLSRRGSQRIRIRIRLERDACAHLVAHCLFPNAERVQHVMDAEVEIDAGAELHHEEAHYHGPFGGVEVVPRARVRVGPHGRYFSDFSLTVGRVGTLRIDYRVETAESALAEINARVFGHGTDEIRIRDELTLAGEGSRGLIKTRVALEDDAASEVIGITHGKAPGARGHMDCLELVRDRAVARAEPIVDVTHPLAKVTHEAAVGTVDQKQLETLMARGLTPDQAVDVIVTGVLR